MLLVAYLRGSGVRDRALRRGERALLGPMIRRSDNAAASHVCDIVGMTGLGRLARRAHMRRFHATRPWGLSTIDVADLTRFFLRIDRYLPRRHRRYAMQLLGSIVPSQRWGIARVRRRGWALYYGNETLRGVAARLRRGLRPGSRPL
jgi:Beta-lactamase enzyme family